MKKPELARWRSLGEEPPFKWVMPALVFWPRLLLTEAESVTRDDASEAGPPSEICPNQLRSRRHHHSQLLAIGVVRLLRGRRALLGMCISDL